MFDLRIYLIYSYLKKENRNQKFSKILNIKF